MSGQQPEPLFAPIAQAVDRWRGFALPPAPEAWPEEGRYRPTQPDEHELSNTSQTLLRWWFRSTPHELSPALGGGLFRYWPHQRRFVETVIYLHEVRRLRSVDQLFDAFGVSSALRASDPWPKLGGQLATGSGKTKSMSLLIVWTVLNALREGPGHLGLGPQALVVAPGLFVRDRLLQDFAPTDRPSVFRADPVVPPRLEPDFALRVYGPDSCPRALAPDEPALIVTNIQQLARTPDEPPALSGGARRPVQLLLEAPNPTRLELDSLPLLARLRPGAGVLVINDEAHHVKDEPDHRRFEEEAAARKQAKLDTADALQWIGALRALHDRAGLGLQVDLSATLYTEEGSASKRKGRPPRLFRHAVMNYPLSEAIRDGVVKRPVLERVQVKAADGTLQPAVLKNQPNAWLTYQPLLLAGIRRWLRVREQLRAEGDPRRPILFLLCADQREAREVANMLTFGVASPQDLQDTHRVSGWRDPDSGELLFCEPAPQGGLRSTVVQVHVGAQQDRDEEEWAKIRAAVNTIDHDQLPDPSGAVDEHGQPRMLSNPYNVVVSVMMLKEGWDVRNVKVIVPLRACDSRTLAEQTLGRGLRRMHPPLMAEDGAIRAVREELYVMEHPSFAAILDQLEDLVELRSPGEIEHVPEYVRIEPLADPQARAQADVRLLRFLRERTRPGGWRGSFSRPRPPADQRLPWLEEFDSLEVSTQLWDAEARAGEQGLTFTIPTAPTYADMDQVIELAYALPLVRALGVSDVHKNDVKAVVKETLKYATFRLPAGIPAPVDEALHSHESARVALCNFLRAEVIKSVRAWLAQPLREAISARRSPPTAAMDERRAQDLSPYTALREHELPRTQRSVFGNGAFDSPEERQFAARLGQCADVLGWVYNHRQGVGFFIEMDWEGHTVRYFPDFIARAQLGGQVHNLVIEVKGRMDRRDLAKARAGQAYAALLEGYDREPWHYLLVQEDPRRGREDLSAWDRMGPPSLGALLRWVERLDTDEADPLAWRLLSRAGVRRAVERLAAQSPEGLPFAELARRAERREAPLAALLGSAEHLSNQHPPRLARVFIETATGRELPETELRPLLSRAAAGERGALAGLEVVYRPLGGPRER